MKKSICLLILLCWMVAANAQGTIDAPFKRFPTLPPLHLLAGDSTTIINKESLQHKRPVVIILFSPECSHCQHEAAELVRSRDSFSDIQLVFSTTYPLSSMNQFAEKYELNKLKHVMIGRDIHYSLPSFYGIKNLPYVALYNKNGKLLTTFEGSAEVPKLLQVLRNN
jgi:thiol-disulfide isomerase/thioredoxin